jgi:hypothetical protein
MTDPTEDGAPDEARSASFGGVLDQGLRWVWVRAWSLAREPRWRTLRWILFLGLAARLILAPLTSWGVDTPFFAISAERMLQTGTPYGGNTFFNPPLGPVLELPLFALAGLFSTPHAFVQLYPGMMPLAIRTQMIFPYLPSSAALLALKLPLILSDLVVAILVFYAVRSYGGGDRTGTLAAAAWFLNPLVIWSSSVHGEVDTLAALFVLGAMLALDRRYAFLTGVLLGLGTFAKIYPIVLVPLAAAYLALSAARGTGWRPRLLPVLRLAGGLGFSALPFVPLLAGFSVVAAHQAGNVNFGGLSVLIVFNPNITDIAKIWPAGTARNLVFAMEAMLGIGVAGAVAAVVYRFFRPARTPGGLPWLSLLALWGVSGSILAVLSTQAENVVALLPLLLVAAPLLGRWGRRMFWIVSVAAWAEYLSLLTPLAYFYPLVLMLGPNAVHWTNGIVIQYALGRTVPSQGTYWVLVGVVGGLTLIALWVAVTLASVRAIRRDPGTRQIPVTEPRPPSADGLQWRRRWRELSRAPPAAVAGGLAAALFVVTLTAVVGVTAAVLTPPPPALQVQVVSVSHGLSSDTITFRFVSGLTPVSVHFGLLPGAQRSVGPVYFFADSAYPDTFGSYTSTHEIAERVSLALQQSGIPLDLSFVDGPGLGRLLHASAPGTIVVLGGVVPDFALSNTTAPLADWVSEGGTLIWAGGSLASEEGHPTRGPFNWDPLVWKGQLDVVHYPLSDPGPVDRLLANQSTPIGAALGTEYNGTPTGANITELRTHGGYDLGIDSQAGANGSSPRTSLAYQPVNYGSVYFFGGALSAQTRPFPSDVPNGDFALSADLAVLLATGYTPSSGSSVSATIELGALSSATVTLTVPTQALTAGVVAIVTTPTVPTPLSIWSTQIQAPSR